MATAVLHILGGDRIFGKRYTGSKRTGVNRNG